MLEEVSISTLALWSIMVSEFYHAGGGVYLHLGAAVFRTGCIMLEEVSISSKGKGKGRGKNRF